MTSRPENPLLDRCAELAAEIKRLREALAYYAEDGHYDSGDVPGHVYVLDDHGDTARVALGQPPRHKHPPSIDHLR